MVVIVIGVSGSGKTAVGQAFAARLGWTFEDADDWHPKSNVEKMRSGHPLTDEDRAPWIGSPHTAIEKWVAEGHDAVLACSALRASHRLALRAGMKDPESVRFVYLKGTYEEIDHRLRQRRGHFMPESLLKSQFETLEEPEASEALVLGVRLQVLATVNAIIAGLHLSVSQLSNMSTS